MLTLIDAVCLAGDRAAQNDDAWGFGEDFAFVIDGATDLHATPWTNAASDAGWLAAFAARRLAGETLGEDPRAAVRRVSVAAAEAFNRLAAGRTPAPRWALPTAAVLLAQETAEGALVADLGDCRAFALGADGQAVAEGGNDRFKGAEAAAAAKLAQPAAGGGNARYRSAEAMDLLRRQREMQNVAGGYAVFGVEPVCAEALRLRPITIARPGLLLLATDGFAALADVYDAYSPAQLVGAALEKGLAAMAEELRAIERADESGRQHPRWKRSDDATALLLRIS